MNSRRKPFHAGHIVPMSFPAAALSVVVYRNPGPDDDTIEMHAEAIVKSCSAAPRGGALGCITFVESDFDRLWAGVDSGDALGTAWIKRIVRGQIWVVGRAKPLLLKLRGNAYRDLAGCVLSFTNPAPPIPHSHLKSLHPYQFGTSGDLTASRRVRVFDIPLDQAFEMLRRGETPPEHMAHCLYLEWFSHRNGRVVIESTDYQLNISAPQ